MSAPTLSTHLEKWLKGHTDAIAFCSAIFRICHVWDDLIDRDVPIQDAQIHDAFWTVMIDLPQNQFYIRNFNALHPILQIGILNWKSANRLERSTVPEHQMMAFAIRAMIADVVAMSALIIGGPLWAEEVHYDMQLSNQESFHDYVSTVKEAR